MTTDRPGPDVYWGTPVTVSPLLPMAPSFNEQIRRRVRHGFADVLTWCGEEVGPAPDELTHAFNTPQGLIVSQEVADNLKRMAAAR